jgi:hypothetical protein
MGCFMITLLQALLGFLDVSAYVIRWLEISIMGFLCHCGDIFNASNGF